MVKRIDPEYELKWRPSTEDVDRLRKELHEPRYPISALKQLDSRFTYRKLNDWEFRRLISPQRDSAATGWRMFTFAESVMLLLISDLKQIGLNAPALRHMLGYLTGFPPGIPWFEIILVSSLRGGRYIFLVDGTGSTTIPMNYKGVLNAIKPDESRGPMVICHVYDYVRRVLSLSHTEVRFTDSFEPREPSLQQRKMLSIIANEDYEQIEITKSDGKVKTIRGMSRHKRKISKDDVLLALETGDYKTVTFTKKGGKIVTLTNTDIHKL